MYSIHSTNKNVGDVVVHITSKFLFDLRSTDHFMLCWVKISHFLDHLHMYMYIDICICFNMWCCICLHVIEIQPLESISWLGDGVKFVSSHSNSSLNYWNLMSCTPSEGPIMHYGMYVCACVQALVYELGNHVYFTYYSLCKCDGPM